MPNTIRIRKGADIKLKGSAARQTTDSKASASFAIKPTDFHGLTPKMLLKEGAEVKAGTTLFYDKYNEHIRFVSPVSGELAAIVRGEKRQILEIRIVPDAQNRFEDFGKADASALGADDVRKKLLDSGLWPLIKQRPYDVVADPKRAVKAVFVSAIDSAPLGVDYDYILENRMNEFQAGITALSRLAKVYLNIRPGSKLAAVKNAEITYFEGPHPSGVVGVQIHHLSPIVKGETVYTVGPQSVAIIGGLFVNGTTDFSKTIALAGSEVKSPRYLNTRIGASIKSIVDGELNAGDVRIISGNVLTGNKVQADGYLGFYNDVVSVIPEGHEPQFMGWLAPNFHKFSLSKAYFSWLMPKKEYVLNTNLNGEDRPFVVSGQYEDLLPMDILPVHLLKSIITNDIEKMEVLGIYEVAPEDFAVCEYACTSKIEVQSILRQGLDVAMKELG